MITYSTGTNRTLNKCYCEIRNAYAFKKLQPYVISDHDLIQLMPNYVQRCERINQPSLKGKIWSSAECEALQCAFETIDWSVILDESDSLELQTTVLTDHINYCVNQCAPNKIYVQYPNITPWISGALISIIKCRRHAIASGQSRGILRRKISHATREAKCQYAHQID